MGRLRPDAAPARAHRLATRPPFGGCHCAGAARLDRTGSVGRRARAFADGLGRLGLFRAGPAAAGRTGVSRRSLRPGLAADHSAGLAYRLGPVTLANVLVSVGFVALHLRAQPLAWAVAVPSLVLGHLRERIGSVWPALLVHAIYNAGLGLTAWLAHG